MKKNYSKPEIIFESFTMSTNIAAGCEKIFGAPARGTCAIPGSLDGWGIFNTAAEGTNCGVDGGAEEKYDGLCYHVPNPEQNFFNS